MVARAVTRTWLASLAASPPVDRSSSPEVLENVRSTPDAWHRPLKKEDVQIPANDDTDDDPNIRVDKRDDIVPRRPGVAGDAMLDESFWSSHHFWKGIVVGAVIVLLVKTVFAVQAPHGVDWFRF